MLEHLAPDVGTRHASVFETRPKRQRPPRLSDGKKHPVVVRRLGEADEAPDAVRSEHRRPA